MSNYFTHNVIEVAYGINKSSYNSRKEGFEASNKDWKILSSSSEDAKTDQYGYKAVAFINHETKEIHITTAGTRPTDPNDLLDDAKITFGFIPNKLEPMKEFVKGVVEKVGEEVKGYKFSTSGHSLGAVISDLTAGEILSRGLQFDKSTTFDTPGSKKVVENALKNNSFSGEMKFSIDEIAEHCVEYNAKPNLINMATPHLAKEIYLAIPNQQTEASSNDKIDEVEADQGLFGFANYLYKTFGKVTKTCSDVLGITTALNEISKLEDHKMHNFKEFDQYKMESWTNSVSNKLVYKHNFTSEQVLKLKGTGADVIIEASIDDEDGGWGVLNAFSYEGLKSLVSHEELAAPPVELVTNHEELEFVGSVFGS
jgi:hypothetical protein